MNLSLKKRDIIAKFISKITILSICFFSITLTSCNKTEEQNKEYTPNPKAIELNNHASRLIHHDILDAGLNRSDSLLYEALNYTEKAITIDSLYYLAYSNKATILCKLEKHDDAIAILEKILDFKPHYAEGIQAQGFIFEKINKHREAIIKYEQALKAYDYRIKKGEYIINSKSSKAFLLIFSKNKNQALKEINNIIKKYPYSQEPKLMKQIILRTNKEEFIRNYN